MSFSDAGRKIVEGAAAGLYEAGTVIMANSQELVPVEHGTLKRSGHVEEPVYDGDHVSVTVGYGYGGEYDARVEAGDGGDGHGYGFWVHEVVERNGHPVRHDPPTQAKFLEVPAEAMRPEVGAFVREGVRAKLDGR